MSFASLPAPSSSVIFANILFPGGPKRNIYPNPVWSHVAAPHHDLFDMRVIGGCNSGETSFVHRKAVRHYGSIPRDVNPPAR